jgi:hypothetical protein
VVSWGYSLSWAARWWLALKSIGRVCQQQNTKKRGIDTLRLNGRLLRCLADEASSLSQVGYWPKADIRGDTLDVRF